MADGSIWYISFTSECISNRTSDPRVLACDALGRRLNENKQKYTFKCQDWGGLRNWHLGSEYVTFFVYTIPVWKDTITEVRWKLRTNNFEIVTTAPLKHTLGIGEVVYPTTVRPQLLNYTPFAKYLTGSFGAALGFPFQAAVYRLRRFVQLCRGLFVYELHKHALPEDKLPPGQVPACLLPLNLWWRIMQYTVFGGPQTHYKRIFDLSLQDTLVFYMTLGSSVYNQHVRSDLSMLDALLVATRAMLLLPVEEPWASATSVHATQTMFEELVIRLWLGNRVRCKLMAQHGVEEAETKTMKWKNSANQKRLEMVEKLGIPLQTQ